MRVNLILLKVEISVCCGCCCFRRFSRSSIATATFVVCRVQLIYFYIHVQYMCVLKDGKNTNGDHSKRCDWWKFLWVFICVMCDDDDDDDDEISFMMLMLTQWCCRVFKIWCGLIIFIYTRLTIIFIIIVSLFPFGESLQSCEVDLNHLIHQCESDLFNLI